MAEQKRRGRPKKQVEEPIVKNEEKKMVTMTESSDVEQQKYRDIQISEQMVQQRWASVFKEYADTGYSNIVSAWNQAWSQLNNPFVQNYRIKQANSKPRKVQQEELQQALANPENSELTLQSLSMYLYYTNYVYNILVKLNRDTPLYKWYVTPIDASEDDTKTDAFKKESKKVDQIIKKFKPSLTLRTVTTQVSLEGKSSYLPRISYDKDTVNFFVLQKLNPDMVKLTSFGSKQQFGASFNMVIFLQPAYDVSQYPKFIQDAWEEMLATGVVTMDKKGKVKFNPRAKLPAGHILENKNGNYMYWVPLPQDLCYTFYFDGSHANMFPDFLGLFDDLSDLDNYKWLQASLLSKGVNSILTAEIPLVKDAKAGQDSTAVSVDTAMGFQDLFAQNVSGNIMPFFAPLQEFELHTLENQPEAMDIIYDRTRDLVATSGNAALMSITDKPSIASVKAQQMIQAARVDYLTRQYENFLNEMLENNFGLKYKWEVHLWGDIFNIREDIKILREQVISGLEGFLPKLLSANDMSIEDYVASQNYLKAYDIKVIKVNDTEMTEKAQKQALTVAKTKTTTTTTKSSSESDIKNSVGRPKLSDSEIENDNTAASADAGTNVSDIKEFSNSFHQESLDV